MISKVNLSLIFEVGEQGELVSILPCNATDCKESVYAQNVML